MNALKPTEDLPPGYRFDPQFGPVCPIYFGYDAILRDYVKVDMGNPADVERYGTDPEHIMARLTPPISGQRQRRVAGFSESLVQTLVAHTGEIHTAGSLLELTFPDEVSEMYRNNDMNVLYNRAGSVTRSLLERKLDKYLPETHAIQRGLQIAKDGKKFKPTVQVMRAILLSQTIETGEIPDGHYTIRWRALNGGRQNRS